MGDSKLNSSQSASVSVIQRRTHQLLEIPLIPVRRAGGGVVREEEIINIIIQSWLCCILSCRTSLSCRIILDIIRIPRAMM